MGGKNRIRKAFERINFLSKNGNQNSMECADNVPSASTRLSSDDTSIITSHSHSRSTTLHQSTSNPDLTKLDLQMERNNFQMVAASQLLAVSGGSSYQHHQDRIQHVLKVFRADQTFKFFVVNLETSAHEVVMLALNEFCIVNVDSSNYSLFMVSVEPGMVIKQKRLPKQQVNLPEMITLNARYYLKNNVSTEPLVYGELLSNELVAEGQVSLLQLDASEVAAQLTLRDFNKFSSIHLTEYIDDIFDTEAKHKNSTQTLEKFAQLANDEMFWVITEICTETNMFKRMKIIKCFIRIAKYCKDCKNFNSMFALISGLGYGAVSRLRQTWDKLPSKYLRIFEDLQSFLNPTRNMSNYRNLANSIAVNPPSIPFFPIVKKDLTFIHLGNDTLVDGLVNFEKLRMISKEIRAISHMTSINYNKRDIYNESSKRRRNSTIPNIKKTYEENHMIRKVQAYLDKIVVVKDENDLDTFSTQCEGNNASGARRREQHSNDNLMTFAPKFGNNSPDAVRKLMSLSDKTLKVKMKPAQSSTTSSTGGGASGTAASAAGGVPSKSTLMRLSTQTPASVLKMPPVSPRLNSLPAKGIRLSSECSSVVATRKIRNSGSICSNDSRMSITSSAPSSSPLMACRTFPQGAITSDADSGHNSAVSSTSTASSVASSSELDQGSPRMPLRTADLLAEADVTDEESTLTRKSPLRTRPSIGSIQSVSSTSSCDRPTLPPYHVLLDNNPELGNYAKHKYNTTNDDAPKSCHPGYTMAPLYPTTSPRPLSEPQHKRVSSAAARLLKHSRSRDSAPFKTNIDQVLNDEDDSQVSAV